MHLLLFAGFLGSGKTSLIIPLAKAVVKSERRAAIVVNEIGEIGIDNQLMRQLDLNVWELVAGCICCTLSADLVTKLQKLDADYAPDLVVVEPSGAADPRNIIRALPYYHGRPLASLRTVSLVDPLRLDMLMEVMTPLITAQIQHADVIVITKSDLATLDQVEFTRRTIHDINPSVRVLSSGPVQPLDQKLLAELLPWSI